MGATVEPSNQLVDEGVYYIRNQRSGLYLDVYQKGIDNGTLVKQDYYNGGENQKFRLKLHSTNIYEIIPLHCSNMSVDISNNNSDNNVQVQIYQTNNTAAQRFKIISTGNGDKSFVMLTETSNFTKCITVHNASMTPSSVIQYSYQNNGDTDNDHWYFEDTTLNEKKLVYLSSGETKTFEITIPDNKNYVVETSKYNNINVDTYLTISNLSNGIVSNDDGGKGNYSLICFNNQGGRDIAISVRFYNSNQSGSFYLQIRKQQAIYYGFEYPDGLNTISDLDKPYSYFEDFYESYKFENEINSHFLGLDFRDIERYNSEIVFVSGHGYKTDDSKGTGVAFGETAIYIDNILDMSNTKIAVWSACYSSNTNNRYQTSLIDKSVECGADSAIGFYDSVDSSSARTFTNNIFKRLSQGYSISEAAEYASNSIIWPWDKVKNYRIAGSLSTTLTDPIYTKSIITENSETKIMESYQHLTSKQEYKVYDFGVITRYYYSIDGIITNKFVDIPKNVYDFECCFDTLTTETNFEILPIIEKINEDNNIIYLIEDGVATPVSITYYTHVGEDGRSYCRTECINLNNGDFIDYSEINSVKG